MSTKILLSDICQLLLLIPNGKVTTYLEIAKCFGNKRLCRHVGNMLHQNDKPLIYPCYKVVNHKGMLSKNYAFQGISMQKKLLEESGVEVINNQVDLKKHLYYFETNVLACLKTR